MKCPKCGFNSFEYNDTCGKCANELSSFKATYGIKPIVMPLEARTALAATIFADEAAVVDEQAAEATGTAEDMFSFDIPEEENAATPPPVINDPFNFGDESSESADSFSFEDFSPAEQAPAAPAGGAEASFTDLLEQNTMTDNPFADTAPTAPAAQSAAPVEQPAAPSSGNENFDLDSFSWDDTPIASPGSPEAKSDDFNDLFGEMDTAKKSS